MSNLQQRESQNFRENGKNMCYNLNDDKREQLKENDEIRKITNA